MNGSRSSNKKHQGANVLNGFGGRLVNEVSKSPKLIDVGEPLPFCTAVSPLAFFIQSRCSFSYLSLYHRFQTPKVRLSHQKNHYIFTNFLGLTRHWKFSKGKKRFIDDLAFLQDGCARCVFKQFRLATILSQLYRPFGRWFFNHIHLNQLPVC